MGRGGRERQSELSVHNKGGGGYKDEEVVRFAQKVPETPQRCRMCPPCARGVPLLYLTFLIWI